MYAIRSYYVSHRKEAGLNPDLVYKLTPFETGSKGLVLTVKQV